MPVANQSLISYVLKAIHACSIDEICLVVNLYNRKAFEQTLKEGTAFGVKITYILQEIPKGIAHALSLCEVWASSEDFLLFLGDNLLEEDLNIMKSVFLNTKSQGTILLKEVDDPRAFGVATVQEGKIVKLVEKPKEPESKLAVLGIYFFSSEIFKVIKHLKPSWRGEYEITDAIALLIEEGNVVNYHLLKGWWKDTGKVSDLLDANRKVLERLDVQKAEDIESEHTFVGENVSIGTNCSFTNCRIEGPSIIGSNVRLQDTWIGRFSSIGNDCFLDHIEIEDSILMERSRLINVPGKVTHSLIGSDFEWVSDYPNQGKTQLICGDYNQIKFH